MTKVIILGQDSSLKKKAIQFVHILKDSGKLAPCGCDPASFNVIELICANYGSFDNGRDFDLMFAFNENRTTGSLFLGHFNDGVVE